MIRFETFERMTLRGRRFFFRIVATGNNEIVSQSQPYKTERQRGQTIAIIKAGAMDAPIEKGMRS